MLGKIKAGAAIIKAFGIAHAPAALFVGGIILVGAAIVETVKAATKKENIDEIEAAVTELEVASDHLETVVQSEDSKSKPVQVKNSKKRKRKAMLDVAKVTAKKFIKPIILIITALIFLICGFWWQSQRLAGAAAAACAATTALNTVNDNIRKIGGDDAVRALNDPNFDPERMPGIIEYDENGNEKYTFDSDAWRKYTKANKISVDPNSFHYLYNEDTVGYDVYEEDITNRLLRLQMTQNYLNSKLKMPDSDGLTVNDVLKELHMNDCCSEAGEVAGWIQGDTIDFGIREYYEDLSNIAMKTMGDIRDEIEFQHGIHLFLNPRGYISNIRYKRTKEA